MINRLTKISAQNDLIFFSPVNFCVALDTVSSFFFWEAQYLETIFSFYLFCLIHLAKTLSFFKARTARKREQNLVVYFDYHDDANSHCLCYYYMSEASASYVFLSSFSRILLVHLCKECCNLIS